MFEIQIQNLLESYNKVFQDVMEHNSARGQSHNLLNSPINDKSFVCSITSIILTTMSLKGMTYPIKAVLEGTMWIIAEATIRNHRALNLLPLMHKEEAETLKQIYNSNYSIGWITFLDKIGLTLASQPIRVVNHNLQLSVSG
jgi:hypothetical protein